MGHREDTSVDRVPVLRVHESVRLCGPEKVLAMSEMRDHGNGNRLDMSRQRPPLPSVVIRYCHVLGHALQLSEK